MTPQKIIQGIKRGYQTKRELTNFIIEKDIKNLSKTDVENIHNLIVKRKSYDSFMKSGDYIYDLTHPVEFFLSCFYIFREPS